MSTGTRWERVGHFLTRRYRILLLGIVLLGLSLQIATYWGLRADEPYFFIPDLDSRYFFQWAEEIVGGDPLGAVRQPRPFFMNPLYPYFLTPFVATFGSELLAIRIFQMLLGLLTVLLVADTTKRLVGPRTGLLAALLAAPYPLLLYYQQKLMIVTLAVFLNALTLWLLSRLRTRPTLGAALLAGFPLGLSVLARPNVVLFAGLVPVWLWFLAPGARRLRFVAARTAVLLAAAAAMVLPVTLRNLFVGGEFVPVTWSMGVNLWQSNNPYAWETDLMHSRELQHNPVLMEADAVRIGRQEIARGEIARRATGRDLGLDEVDDFWDELVRREIARRRIAMDGIAFRSIAEESLGREPTDPEVRKIRTEWWRRLLAMHKIATREIAKRELATREVGRRLTAAEVRAHWKGREITEEEVREAWSGRQLPLEDVRFAWKETSALRGVEGPPSQAEIDRELRRLKATPAEIFAILTPEVNAYWQASGATPEKLAREVDDFWSREITKGEVADSWGDSAPTPRDVESVVAPRVEEFWQGHALRMNDVSGYWTAKTLNEVSKRPGPAAAFLLRKFLYCVNGFETPSSYHFGAVSERVAPLDWLPLSFGFLAPFMILGCFLVLRPVGPALIFAFLVATYVAGLTLFFPLAHYRAPMLPAVFPLAAIALTRLVRTVAVKGERRLRLWIGLLACLAVTLLPMLGRGALGFEQIERASKDRVVFYYSRGLAFMKLGEMDRAERAFSKAVEFWPTSYLGWQGLATVAQFRGNLATEAIQLERALEVSDGVPLSKEASDAIYRRWRALSDQGLAADAEAYLLRAIQEHPGSLLPTLWLAQSRFDSTTPEIWKDSLERAVDLRPRAGFLWALLALNWANRGHLERGVVLARFDAARNPDRHRVLGIYGNLCFDSRLYEEALLAYRKAEAVSPRVDDGVIVDQVQCLRLLNRQDEAWAELSRGLHAFPESVGLRIEETFLLHVRGEIDMDEVRRRLKELEARGGRLPADIRRLLDEK